MKKLILFSLLIALFCACSDKDQSSVIFVTDVVMPSEVADPGEEVMIAANGFEAADDIFVRTNRSILRAEVVRAEYAAIRFIVPGGLPAGDAEILLMRQGQFMVLGLMSLSDGLPPTTFSLYGVGLNLAGETVISRIDLETGAVTAVTALGEDERLVGITNAEGTNRIYGINNIAGERKPAWYDLTMKRYAVMDGEAITMGVVGGAPTCLFRAGPGMVSMFSGGLSRAESTPLRWRLPEAITPEMLAGYPFVPASGNVLFAARTAAGSFRPIALALSTNVGVVSGDEVQADGFIPFHILKSSNSGPDYLVGGYAVVQENETVFRLFNPLSAALDEEVFRVPAAVVSCTNAIDGTGTKKVYLLCRTGNGLQVYSYDLTNSDPKAAFKPLTGEIYFSEIVLAR